MWYQEKPDLAMVNSAQCYASTKDVNEASIHCAFGQCPKRLFPEHQQVLLLLAIHNTVLLQG